MSRTGAASTRSRPEERIALWDKLYDEPGFGIWLSNFREIFTDEAANAEFSAYIADRIRRRVKDPVTGGESLFRRTTVSACSACRWRPTTFEAYNRDNVHLVDLSETPIERVTATGLRTSARDYELDILVYSTGFDAITGSFDAIDITGVGGVKLADQWRDGPSTFLGMMAHGFPNLLMPTGPQSGSASTNFPRGIENGVGWCMGLLEHIWRRGYTRAEPTAEAQARWTAHVTKMYAIMLMRKAKSWFTGYNSNIPGHEHGKTRYLVYNGGTPKYVAAITDVAQKGYEGIVFDAQAMPSATHRPQASEAR
jgi:cyclohexanone monooxygenase